MRQTICHSNHRPSGSRRIGGPLGLLLALALLGADLASAGYEQAATFGISGQGRQLPNAYGMAVNTTGAGGVPAGTVYIATGFRNSVAVYDAHGEFRQAWGWGVAPGPGNEFQRCGPDGEASHPVCKSLDPEGEEGFGSWGEGEGQFSDPQGVAVDQSTGNVYVMNRAGPQREHGVIEVFNADGSELITSFGDVENPESPLYATPNGFHRTVDSGIAVDEAGSLYVSDRKSVGVYEDRIMIFEPESPGDYEHYVYTGRSNDIVNTSGPLALDSSGDLYALTGSDGITERDAADLNTSICGFHDPAEGLLALTVDPQTGEPFYFSYKTKKIHRLSACNAEGKFVAKESFSPTPKTGSIQALAFNPTLAYSPDRPIGALYAVDTETRPEIAGLGEIFAPAEVHLPSVESESVTFATSSTATLNAEINPKGSETSYVFQYLTAAEYEANEPAGRFAGAREAPLGGAVLGSGQVALNAATTVSGLVPDTEYRYRAIATSHCEPDDEAAVCEDVGADATFRTFPVEAPGLPDDRAYELVSPAMKNGGEVFPLNPGRGSCGSECKPGAASQAFPRQSSPDGQAVVYEGQPFSLTEGATVYNEYLSRRTPSGWQTTVLAPRLMGSNGWGYKAFDSSLSQGILYQGRPSLTPEAPSEFANLYTQPTANPSALSALLGFEPPNRTAGALELAYAGASADFSRHFFAANDSLTGEAPFAPAAVDGGAAKNNLYESAGGELRLVNVLPGNAETAPGAYFGAGPLTVQNDEESKSALSHAISDDGSRVFWSDEAGQVYVRENGETTTEIPDPAKFLTASADGSKVLLRNGHLYDLETEAITDLSGGQGGFQGIVGQSEDLSRIYFVDTAVLTGGDENQYGAKAEAGKYNLYSWQGGSSTFVATLLATDNAFDGGGDWHFTLAERTAEASPDGRWVSFLSTERLTGYGNNGPCGGPCKEVFLYDSAAGELSCPSCNPSDATPRGSSNLSLIPQGQGAEDPLPQPRYLTDEGRLYFDSQDSLTPFDANGRVEDVYQYQPQGVGSCKREGGCVSLISAGTGSVDSNFLAIDASGKSVFFTTRDQLLLRDRDELVDLYVAREGGGIPAETEAGRGECQGEACQPVIAAPNDPTPGSLSFQGAGNVEERKAAKKQKKQKKKHAKKRRAKKHKDHNRTSKRNRGGAR